MPFSLTMNLQLTFKPPISNTGKTANEWPSSIFFSMTSLMDTGSSLLAIGTHLQPACWHGTCTTLSALTLIDILLVSRFVTLLIQLIAYPRTVKKYLNFFSSTFEKGGAKYFSPLF